MKLLTIMVRKRSSHPDYCEYCETLPLFIREYLVFLNTQLPRNVPHYFD